jgi:NADH-quinone oxidoreductase subunit L
MLRYIILFPLLGAAINWLVGRRVRNELFVSIVGCGVIALSTVFAVAAVLSPESPFRHEGNKPILDHLWTWIQVGNFRADFGLALDRLSGIYVLFVTFVGFLIHVFATGYMHGDPGFYRFFAYLNLFMFSMLTLVLGDNFLMMFVGWEGVGLCSYLLIGYYVDKDEARVAAKKAFVANRIGDWGVVLGVLLLFYKTGSISFFDKPAQGVASALTAIAAHPEPFGWGLLFAGGITSIALLLFIGATGKSAQIPLFVWLPDAMAGPTPVSALIHAATMVTAGVYMVVRCNAIYSNAPTAMFVVAIIGAATALLAATIGIAQNDIKKVLAYSTVSQLGYMFLACGVGAYIAAIFHVMTHAFFKAQLFLGSGSVIHGMHHQQDMRFMGGLRKYMKITWLTMIAGTLAICGIFPLAGFFSKDEILWKTFSATQVPGGKVFWFIGALTALLTATYMTRMMWMTFWGEERFKENSHGHGHEHTTQDAFADTQGFDSHQEFKPHESPVSMTGPLIVLAALSIVGGLVGIPHVLGDKIGVKNYFEHALEPVIVQKAAEHGGGHAGLQLLSPAPQPTDAAPPAQLVKTALAGEGSAGSTNTEAHGDASTELGLMVLSVVLALAGIGAGIFIFKKDPLKEMPQILQDKWRVDELYDWAIINPVTSISRSFLWQTFDLGVIDGIVNGTGKFMSWLGGGVRHLQGGLLRSYAAIILLGALFVVGYFITQFIGVMAR